MLRQLMNTDEAGEDENVEEDVPSPEEDAGADKISSSRVFVFSFGP